MKYSTDVATIISKKSIVTSFSWIEWRQINTNEMWKITCNDFSYTQISSLIAYISFSLAL